MKKYSNNNHSFSVITAEEGIENDKLRLKRKFNFISLQPSINDDRISIQSNQSSTLSLLSKTQQMKMTPGIMSKSQHSEIQSQCPSRDNIEIDSDNCDTQREDRELIDDVMRNKRHFVTQSINDNIKNTSINNDCEDDELDITNHNNCIIKYDSQARELGTAGNPFKSKETNEYSQHCQKILKLFSINDECDVASIGLLDDEYIKRNDIIEKSQCKFISEIKLETQKIPMLSISKLKNLEHKALVNMISFIFNDYESLINSSLWLKHKINLSLSTVFNDLIVKFKMQYGLVIDMKEYYFSNRRFRKGKTDYPLFDLVIKGKIIKNPQKNTCYILRYSYSDQQKNHFIQSFIFDIRKQRTFPIWFINEVEEYKNKKICYAYSQPIHSLCYGDSLILRINILNKGVKVDISSFSWLPLKNDITDPPIGIYEKTLMNDELQYDSLRHSEIENMIRLWKNEKAVPLPYKNLKEEFDKIFSKLFKNITLFYDLSKFSFFKIHMEAYSIGIIHKNKFLNSIIEVIKEDSPIEQECFCIGLLNIQQSAEKYQIRKGTKIIFYIVDY